MDLSLIVGFGGVLLLSLIGFLYVWFSTPPKRKPNAEPPEAPQPSSRR